MENKDVSVLTGLWGKKQLLSTRTQKKDKPRQRQSQHPGERMPSILLSVANTVMLEQLFLQQRSDHPDSRRLAKLWQSCLETQHHQEWQGNHSLMTKPDVVFPSPPPPFKPKLWFLSLFSSAQLMWTIASGPNDTNSGSSVAFKVCFRIQISLSTPCFHLSCRHLLQTATLFRPRGDSQ